MRKPARAKRVYYCPRAQRLMRSTSCAPPLRPPPHRPSPGNPRERQAHRVAQADSHKRRAPGKLDGLFRRESTNLRRDSLGRAKPWGDPKQLRNAKRPSRHPHAVGIVGALLPILRCSNRSASSGAGSPLRQPRIAPVPVRDFWDLRWRLIECLGLTPTAVLPARSNLAAAIL